MFTVETYPNISIIDKKDIASEIQDFVLKYVLFDDVIDWEKDVAFLFNL